MQPPQQGGSARDFDQAVQPESEQRNTAGHDARDQRSKRFKAIPQNRELLQASAPLDEATAVGRCSLNHSHPCLIQRYIIPGTPRGPTFISINDDAISLSECDLLRLKKNAPW